MQGFVVAGERSGVGKTIITLALAHAFAGRGMRVQCFKVGPDFIDPGLHSIVAGSISRNLDGWMLGEECCRTLFAQHAGAADIALIEGVMGLHDGRGSSEDGSTAQMAAWLGLPILLIVDGSSFSRSAGALVLGYRQFDPRITLAGVLFNRVSSERHFDMLRSAVEDTVGVRVFGHIPSDSAWQLPERHLGLVTAEEQPDLHRAVHSLSDRLSDSVDLDALAELNGVCAPSCSVESAVAGPAPKIVRIGIARDEAFCFYYQDNLDLLQACGAELVSFSPLHDSRLPDGLHGLYLGGGYPELHAARLSANADMRNDVLDFCTSGKPVYAECGGFLYLLASVTARCGTAHPMAGLFPARAHLRTKLQRLGYIEAEARSACPFLHEGLRIRGHEFHYSDISPMPDDVETCYSVRRARSGETFSEGYRLYNVLAGYLHLHFLSQPEFAAGFVKAAQS